MPAVNPHYNNFFGAFGGRYVAEVLRAPLDELEREFKAAMVDNAFLDELATVQREYIGRPTPLLHARNASAALGGAQIYIKLEGLANTGAHKINNAAGQILLAKRMGKKRIIAETGAGQHGVATAAMCAKFGLPCTVYMGEVDIARQRPNVYLMELYGAKVVSVTSGSRTLKDAVNEALRDWAGSFADTHYLLGSALGPSPFPDMVREFQAVIGREVVDQAKTLDIAALIACVGGGSNSIGFFEPFLSRSVPRLIGVEAGGRGAGLGQNAVRMGGDARPGVVQGYKSYFLLDDDGQMQDTHSVSAGLDYAGIGPQLAHLGQTGRVEFASALDSEVLEAVQFFARHEGVIFALESAHAGAHAMKLAPTLPRDKAIIVNMSGRGDKDIFISAKLLTPEPWIKFLKAEVANYGQSQAKGGSLPLAAASSAVPAGSSATPSVTHPPYRLETARTVVRCWNPEDAPLLKAAVDRNIEHLRTSMGWIAHEPTTLEAKFELLRMFRGKFDLGQDFTYGIFNKDETLVLGGTGLHRRDGPHALEIGYWLDKDHLGQGLATEVAGALAQVALTLKGIDRVEIRHEPDNVASGRVPEKLGFTREALLHRVNDHFEGELRDSVVWVKFR